MSWRKKRVAAAPADVLDRAHLVHYTMENPALEREIIELFLSQLPVALANLKGASSQAEWKLATHTLKARLRRWGPPGSTGLQLSWKYFDLT